MYWVLAVDDEQEIREGLRELIDWEGLGFSINNEADNGQRAYELMKTGRYDVLFTDIRLPAMTGLEVINRLQKEGIRCKMVVFSAHADFEYARTALGSGVKKYLLKPINEEELAETFREIRKELDHERLGLSGSEEERALKELILIGGGDSSEKCGKGIRLGPHCLTKPYACHIVKLDQYERQNEVLGGIREILDSEGNGFVFAERPGVLVLLVSGQGGGRGGISAAAGLICRKVRSIAGSRFFMVSGRVVEEASSINSSYNSAQNLVLFGLNMRRGDIVAYEEVRQNLAAMPGARHFTPDRLIKAVKLYDIAEVERQIDNLKEYLENSSADIFTVYGTVSSVMLGIAEDEEGFEYSGILEEISASRDIGKIVGLLKSACIEACRNISNGGAVMSKLKLYVEDNCSGDINIKKISKEFGYNASYIGRLFSQREGMSIKDYINLCRINLACRLLLEDRLNIADIAAEAGFSDLNRFYAAFRKIKGCTPKKYKSLKEKELENDILDT